MEEKIIDTFRNSIIQRFNENYRELCDKKIVVYGASNYGSMMVRALTVLFGKKGSIVGISDSNEEKWGKYFECYEVKPIWEFDKDITVVIGTQYYDDVKHILEGRGYNVFQKSKTLIFIEKMMNFYVYNTAPILATNLEEQIYTYNHLFLGKEKNLLKMFRDKESQEIIENRVWFYKSGNISHLVDIVLSDKTEYFDRSIFKMSDEEVYVDCGTFDGDSVIDFINAVNGEYKLIYAFEPDHRNYNKLQNLLESRGIKNVVTYNIGVGKESKDVRFSNLGTMGSFVSSLEIEDDSELVEIKPLDSVIGDKISLIKMDIEGEEYNALLGAEELIKKYKPKLAICLYHKCEHFFNIPLYLKTIVPEYDFVLKQHNYFEDVILYASVNT